jgi:hypothetical protein
MIKFPPPDRRTNMSFLRENKNLPKIASQLLGHCTPLSISDCYAAPDEGVITREWQDLLDRYHTAIAIEPRGEDEQPS